MGVYEFSPGFNLTVTREGDRLFAEPTGDTKVEMLPTSETEFFPKDMDNASLTFARDDKDIVSGATMKMNGQELTGKRKDE